MAMSVKNISFKVVLLLLVILASIGAVLIFAKTIAENPPESPQVTTDKYNGDLKGLISKLNEPDYDSLEYQYQMLKDRINLFAEEGLIDENKKESLMQNFIEVYVGKFNDWCDRCFSNSVWNDKGQHLAMLTRIGEIRKMNLANMNSYSSTLNKIEGVIKDYNEAWNLTKRRDWKNASTIVNTANRYMSSYPLLNCADLKDALSQLPENLGKSHRQYVDNEIGKLGQYYNYNVCDYKNNVVIPVNNEIKKYKNCKSQYNDYNDVNVNKMKNKCSQEMRYAESYYYRQISNMDRYALNRQPYRNCFNDIWGYYPTFYY
ncbi:MAG: hypothetical protein IJK62_14125 [Bacteroidales bacterium]|nr:hypothetical protein [Bacteroidales bacterium]